MCLYVYVERGGLALALLASATKCEAELTVQMLTVTTVCEIAPKVEPLASTTMPYRPKPPKQTSLV